MIGGRSSRLAAAVVSLLAVVGLAQAPALAAGHASALQTKWARYTFHGSRGGFLIVTGRVDAAPGAFFATADEFSPTGSTPQVLADVIDLDSSGQVGTYGAAGNRDLCEGPVTCFRRNGGLVFSSEYDVEGDGKHRFDLAEYIVARGAHVEIRDRFVVGWKAAHRTGGVLRRTVADLTGAGVDAEGLTAGAELGVSAPGKRGGSVAIAVPGCDVVGAGELTLAGGDAPVLGLCPSLPIASVTDKATTWHASGALAGVSDYLTRLLVIDA